ncbi:hypothetical protein SAMN05216553_108394 [Lentzea fradiae]|uniref:Uncharacterized protein n=1 Tax=Lentzea fradiae TaxID=200378 RepID=A0A1G7UT16_9PSEU|nr:hypothetical protein [Lentzea fradiae]SDG50627.1 hypothetical protein SAMN05216553_108394 [Lentzea fradiae]
MPVRGSKSQRMRFWIITCTIYLGLIMAAVLLHDQVPWAGAAVGALGGSLVLAALLGWWRRHPSNPDRAE